MSDLLKQTVDKYGLEEDAVKFAIDYFSYYFHNPSLGELTEDKIPEYVSLFQSMVGVEVDGNLNNQVVKAMKTIPRCGCRDYSLISPQAFGNSPRWGVNPVSYFIQKYVTGLSKEDQDSLIKQAFDSWSSVANCEFVRSDNSNANIIISTGRGASDNFDGPSGTLAWAYLPPRVNFTGQLTMKFDLDETWIKNTTNRGILYLNVATHEIGHLLGLDHSKKSGALMAPYYAVGISKPQPDDDIPRIQSLYGKPEKPPVNPPPKPTNPGKIRIEILVDSLDDIKIDGKDTIDFSLI